MKIILLFLLFAGQVFGQSQLVVAFPAMKESVVINVEDSQCPPPKKVSESYFQLNCKRGSIPVMLIREFRYPGTILSEIKGTNFEDLKKLGEKAIQKKVLPWGIQYWWSTPSYGTSFRTYLCPKNKNHCYYVVADAKAEFMVRSK